MQLREAKDADFALEKRRLEFQLDYENARKKEKHRLAVAIQAQRSNDIEIRRQKIDPSYKPKLIMPELTPPLTLPRFEAWVDDLDREPRRFIMPGQTVEDFEWELKRFYNILQKMEDLDCAAGLMQPLTRAADEMGPLTTEEEMMEFDDENVEKGPLASSELQRSLKRKRSIKMEEPPSSQPSVSKRLRRISNLGPSTTHVRREFKNDGLRPGKLLEYNFHHKSLTIG